MIAKFKLPFKSGDVLRDREDGELMTCIGVAERPNYQALALQLLVPP